MARRFCLVAYAGKVACDAGVLPEDMDVWAATVSCFNDWLAVRGGAGAGKDAAIVERVQWNAADGSDVTFEDAERASCYLAIVEEVRRTMLELCSAEKMYDMK